MGDLKNMPVVTVEQVVRFRECALSEIAALESRLAAAEATINAVYDALTDAPEINPSNYDHDQVCALNRETCYAHEMLKEYIDKARGEGDD